MTFRELLLTAASSLEKEVKEAVGHTGNKEAARKVGELFARESYIKKESLKVYSTEVDIYVNGRMKRISRRS